jgi:CheY-like chemotaxis protein
VGGPSKATSHWRQQTITLTQRASPERGTIRSEWRFNLSSRGVGMLDSPGPLLLYVEDEPLIMELGVTAFEDAGFDVIALASGEKAIAALDERGAEFTALVTDIDLSTGTNGWEVARHARELFPALPVIYVSGGSSGDWPSMGVPGSTMLNKPYAAAQLVVAVSSATLGAGGPQSDSM